MRSVVLATAIQLAVTLLAASPASAGERAGAADSQLALAQTGRAVGEVYAFPNPARQVAAVTFHAEVAGATGVELRVYNAAGELVHEGQLSGDPSVTAGGSAYEYQWNLANVASGNYFLIVSADRDGRSDVVAKKTFSVIQ